MSFAKFPSVFVKLTGRNGIVREFNALIDPGAEYCLIPKVDAYALGYPEAANDNPITPKNNTLTFTGFAGYGRAALINLVRVDVGSLPFDKVEFVAVDIPQATGFDVVLGRSLLRFMRLEFDYPNGRLMLEKRKEVTQ